MPPKRKAAKANGQSGKKAKVLGDSSEESVEETAAESTSAAAATNGFNLKISSWNVNGIRAWLDKKGLDFVKGEQPDMFVLQETKCNTAELPTTTKLPGYKTYWLSGDRDGYSGVGLYTKEEPLSISYGMGNAKFDKDGRLITAEYPHFYLLGAYVPNSGRGLPRLGYRQEYDQEFLKYISDLDSKKPVIYCGDLNVAHNEIDLANPKTNTRTAGFTKEERSDFTELLKAGFCDSYRQLYPTKTGAYTFWSYMRNARQQNVGWRLDYFVISNRLKGKLVDNVIHSDVMGSDHCPISLLMNI